MRIDCLFRGIWQVLREHETRLSAVEHRLIRMETRMGKNSDALARLDAEIDGLRDYVESDDATDAAEVDTRAERIRAILAEARGDATVDNAEVDTREDDLNEVVDSAAQTAPVPSSELGDDTAL